MRATPSIPRNPFLDIINGKTENTAICVDACECCPPPAPVAAAPNTRTNVPSSPQSLINSDADFSDDESNDSVLGGAESEGEGEWLDDDRPELSPEALAAENKVAAEDSFIDDDSEAGSDDGGSDEDSDFSMSTPQSNHRPARGARPSPVVIDLNTSSSSSISFASSNNSPPLQMYNHNTILTANLLQKPTTPPPVKVTKKKPAVDRAAPTKEYEDHFLVPSDATKKLTAKNRTQHLNAYFSFYNRTVFSSSLTAVKVSFSNKLLTTAGITRLRRSGPTKTCAIELSAKVCDDVPRLASTLLHEMCHAGQFLIDDVTKPPHGPAFQKYVSLVNRFYPHLQITTCHNYEIKYSYAWACTMGFCGCVIGRHSRSVDVVKHVCGKCKGKLMEIDAKKYYNDGDVDKEFREKTPVKKRETSAYNLYVKENEKKVRMALLEGLGKEGGLEKGEVMRELGRRWKEDKVAFTEKVKRDKEMGDGGKGDKENNVNERKDEVVVVDVDSEWEGLFGGGSDGKPEEDDWQGSLSERLKGASLK